MGKFVDFFADELGRMSMGRLLTFLAFFVASGIIINESANGRAVETMFGLFLGTFAFQFVGGKAIDAYQSVKQTQADMVTGGTNAGNNS